MKKLNTRRAGFTLIELMIVFVIIIILAGMVLRLMGLASTRNAEALTREKLERVAQALEEFRATYGRYPPVDYYPGNSQPTEYEYPVEGDRSMPDSVKGVILSRSKEKSIWSEDGHGRVFTFGLLSYFFPRYTGHAEASPDDFIGRKPDGRDEEGDPKFKYEKKDALNQWYEYNDRKDGQKMGDIVQNIESSRRILPYLGVSLTADGKVEGGKYGIVHSEPVGRNVDKDGPESLSYSNQQLLLLDGWRRSIHYRSRPPYDSYRLWSSGADGVSGTDDDIVVGEG